MQVAKWGNSLAVRIPVVVVEALGLVEGAEVEVRVASDGAFEITRAPDADEVLDRIRKYRGRLPRDFRFDRQAAHER
ncbi:MAG: AbrB/MazE/SpoVT family DNA-binding domain-containing protein [Gammaproteobacteria bacterium]|nr:AbrB/MazE/SpoVT family DNA-binding domain-containing protein [Gammaproteobacteria bacterium]